MRAFFSTLSAIAIVGKKDLYFAVWSGVPEGCFVKLIKRSTQMTIMGMF